MLLATGDDSGDVTSEIVFYNDTVSEFVDFLSTKKRKTKICNEKKRRGRSEVK